MEWLRRLWMGCLRGHRWQEPVWTGSRWLHICERGCVKWTEAR